MKVLILPNGRGSGNPYQELLAFALAKQGVKICWSIKTSFLAIFRSLGLYGKSDVVHLHWANPYLLGRNRLFTIIKSFLFILELLVLKFLRIKIVWTIHNIAHHEEWHYRLEITFNKIIAQIADVLIAHSISAKKEILKHYCLSKDSKVVIIPHGHYIGAYANEITKSEARRKLGCRNDDVIFLFFGNIRPYKGIFELLKSFEKMSNEKIFLLLVGEPYNNEIKKRIMEISSKNNKVKPIFGFIPPEDIQIFMNASDIVVLPYKEILNSGALLLAMSFGKPVIAPKLGSIPDILDNQGGFLYNPKDADGLLLAMENALKVDFVLMGQYNFQKVKQFDWDKIANQTVEVYRH